MDLKRKKITVVGLGKTGISSTLFLRKCGLSKIRVTENTLSRDIKKIAALLLKRDIEVEIGKHTKNFIKGSDLIVTSPGVKLNSKPLLWARQENIEIISEIELAYQFCKAPIIAVTGTNGKSTVTALIGKILADANKNAIVCGNIGTPFIEKVPNITENDIVVLETSSFQLAFVKDFKPHIALLLNISQNHLDWHNNMNQYLDAKCNIFKNQSKKDFVILNYEDKNLHSIKDRINSNLYYFSRKNKVRGAYIKANKFYISLNGSIKEMFGASETRLKGEHNLENILAAIVATALYEVSPTSIRKSVADFEGLEHRFELVDTLGGVKYINDSKSTTVDSTLKAINSCEEKVVLIAGGRDKGSDFTVLKTAFDNKLRHVILIGEAKEKIAKNLRGFVPFTFASSIKEAVLIARRKALVGDCVMLSPMCASFDMFKNFEERGNIFKKLIFGIKNSYEKE
ncbi:MAG: UDP-N-acetylmuramoyl-L-alanine--D-glutamate ligase [Candidatus Omnitrophica bacterium]|nr:UDP-N-acetylmuramoyl-L-alanine--D-glutamate ligase [Candidatus Omnitrophota bacterium]